MINWLLLASWFALLRIAFRRSGPTMISCVGFQFVFVGLGLSVFPIVGFEYMQGQFPSFELRSLTQEHFQYANFLVLLGCSTTLTVHAALGRRANGRLKPSAGNNIQSIVNPEALKILTSISWLVGIPFVVTNINDFAALVFAQNVDALSGAVELRIDAVNNYLVTLVIYNVLPSTAILLLCDYLFARDRRSLHRFLRFGAFVSLCLLLTYQKHPLLLFLLSCVLVTVLSRTDTRDRATDLIRALRANRRTLLWAFVAAYIILNLLYYVNTSYRFGDDGIRILVLLPEIAATRIVGRLSIPAAMYVEYFPQSHDFYGLTNVGLFSKVFGTELYADTAEVMEVYCRVSGHVAASTYIDAYGQAGTLGVVLWSVVIGFLAKQFDHFMYSSLSGVHRIYCINFIVIFMYTMSQASLFRTALGYGGFAYFLVWYAGFKAHAVVKPKSPRPAAAGVKL